MQQVDRRPKACHTLLGSACRSRSLTISSHGQISCERMASGCGEHAEHEQGERACTSCGRDAWQRPQRRSIHAKSARARTYQLCTGRVLGAASCACRSGSGGRDRSTTRTALRTRFETRKRAWRGPFRSALTPLLPCAPEAPRGPSTALRSFFRKFLAL